MSTPDSTDGLSVLSGMRDRRRRTPPPPRHPRGTDAGPQQDAAGPGDPTLYPDAETTGTDQAEGLAGPAPLGDDEPERSSVASDPRPAGAAPRPSGKALGSKRARPAAEAESRRRSNSRPADVLQQLETVRREAHRWAAGIDKVRVRRAALAAAAEAAASAGISQGELEQLVEEALARHELDAAALTSAVRTSVSRSRR